MDLDFKKIADELKDSKVTSGKRYTGISQKTQENYIAKLKTLEKRNVFNDLKGYFETIKIPNTRIAYQTAVIGTAKHSPTFKKFIGDDKLNEIIDIQDKFIESQKPLRGTQLKTTYESDNWIDWKDLKKLVNENQELTQDNILLHIYTQIPPSRLDFHNLLIIHPDEVVKSASQNYIQIINKRKSKLVLQDYKTSQTYGTNEIELPARLSLMISSFVDLDPERIYLFEKQSQGHKPFASAETFARYLKDIFYKLTNKNISVDLLRHSFITHFRSGDVSLKKKERVAKIMGNSVATQEDYRRID